MLEGLLAMNVSNVTPEFSYRVHVQNPVLFFNWVVSDLDGDLGDLELDGNFIILKCSGAKVEIPSTSLKGQPQYQDVINVIEELRAAYDIPDLTDID